MSYFPPYIDENGLAIPTYSDIRDQLISDAKSIFGQDIYLGNDSMDYQWISAVAVKIYDAFQLAAYVYNNRGPGTAIGTALDGIVKLNGLSRESSTYSVCTVTITGTAGTVIANGIIADVNGVLWGLPASVMIPIAGTIDVVATCKTSGAISANIGEIIIITTPTYGWTAVTNAVAADVGSAVETDSELRERQSVSSALPSRSLLEGTKAEIAAVTGVTRFVVYENNTASTDSDSIPAHSICAVVEGGDDEDIASAIFNNKSIGCGTYGTTTETVIDDYGQETDINFYRPTYKDIDVVVAVKSLTGYTTETTADIKTAIADFLGSLSIANDVSISSLWGAALQAMPDLKTPLFSITALTACLHSGSPGTTDIAIAFNQVARGNTSYITVNVT
jgi:uncharacterized phage protein gp47/JayE